MSPFNPESLESRRELGAALLGTLTTKGFKLDPIRPGTERVARWDQNMPAGMVVAIYTTVEGDGASATVRGVGEDAIRVVLLYTAADGTERGLATATRVHRTGQIPAIVERTLERARECYSKGKHVARCSKCGAPLFTAKSGKAVCAEICWTKPPAQPAQPPQPKSLYVRATYPTMPIWEK